MSQNRRGRRSIKGPIKEGWAMHTNTFRVTDAASGEVLASVQGQEAMSSYLHANNRYEVSRVSLPDVTVVATNITNTNRPGP